MTCSTGASFSRVLRPVVAVLVLLLPAAVLAGSNLRGDLGIDLQNFGFNSSLTDTNRVFDVNRALSNHYLDLAWSGPLLNSHFANYFLRGRVYGTYFRSTIGAQHVNQYFHPDLHSYTGQVTLFPDRPYPLKLFHSRTKEYALRYESNNRTDVEILQPQLAVIRRYDDERRSTGGILQAALNEKTNLLGEYKYDVIKSLRNYDFGEDRDIWVSFSTILYNPLRARDTIQVKNELPDAELAVVIDNITQTTIAAGQRADIAVDSGFHEVLLAPLSYYNQYSFRLDVRGNMIWRVVYKEPASPRDQNQHTKGGTLNLRYDDGKRLTNETFVEYSNQEESFQRLNTGVGNFANTARYAVNDRTDVQLLTTYARNRAEVDTISFQETRSLLHTTTLRYAKKAGLSTSLSHTFNRNQTNTDIDRLVSNMQILSGRLSLPRRWLDYRLNVRNDVSLLSDNRGYVNNQFSTDVSNSIGFSLGALKLSPKHEFKFIFSDQKNPDESSKEIDTRFIVRGELPGHRIWGNITFRAEYNYRNKYDQVGSDIRNRYVFDFSVIKKFSPRYRLMLLSTQELEAYGGSSPVAASNQDQGRNERPDLHKSSYKIDFHLSPIDRFSFGSGFMLITQDGTIISRLNLTLNATLPGLELPIRSFLTTEARDISGLPRQTRLTAETKVSYQFRQITLLLSHSYSKETLITQTYSYYELQAEIRRRFSMF